MKRLLFKPVTVVCLLTLLLSLSSSMGNKRFVLARYTQSNAGGSCFPFTTMPEVCTPSMTGIICTTPFGSLTRTWYSDACATPYYKWP